MTKKMIWAKVYEHSPGWLDGTLAEALVKIQAEINEYGPNAIFNYDKDFYYPYDERPSPTIFIRVEREETDVREVCRKNPEIIKKLDKDILADSKLTCKEWVLLTNSIMNNNEKKFEDWEFSDDLIGIFKLDLMAEMLTGKSKISKRFQSAMKNVFDKEEESEAEAVVGSTLGEVTQV